MLTQSLLPSTLAVSPARPPAVRELPADLETPVSIYLKLAGRGPSFLLESVTQGEHVARYSFVGVEPRAAYVIVGGAVRRVDAHGRATVVAAEGQDPLAALRAELARQQPGALVAGRAGLPPFTGGLVGYLSYDAVRYFEPAADLPRSPSSGGSGAEGDLPRSPSSGGRAAEGAPQVAAGDEPELPDGIFLLADTVVAFDHAYGRMLLIANVDQENADEAAARRDADARLDAIQARLAGPLPAALAQAGPAPAGELRSNIGQDEFMAAVARAKEYIAAGDIFQVVLSQRFSRRTGASPFAIYRALRRLNPSPYMFFFDFAGLAGEPFHLIGASPEVHVRLNGRAATLRPIAGTRPRGRDDRADAALAAELLADPKERAEHVMLVDLGRNDLGRVCTYGSVRVSELMAVERYSHVMHIVSQVEGTLCPDLDAFDLLRATFPAGTVSGAPKIRAMQIIGELENLPRGPYAGAVGYFSYDGSMDTCITIRTLVMRGDTVSVQAGAGIVADSDPEREHQECVNKARALAVAVANAEERQ